MRIFTGGCPGCGGEFSVDDISFSPFAQPDTEILAGPPPASASRDATFFFIGNQPDSRFECSLDGAVVALPRAGVVYGPRRGAHAFTVTMRDRYGTSDITPATHTWTVGHEPAGRSGSAGRRRRRGRRRRPRDNCPAATNPSQPDGDADGVGDACEVAVPGISRPCPRERRGEGPQRRHVRGATTTASALAPARAGAAISGFVPMKGAACACATRTIVDARKGASRDMTSTVDGRRIGAGGSRQTATLAAGIFRIRQLKQAPGARTKVPTDLVLQSAPGAEAACVRTGVSGPIKGRGRNTVRSLTAGTEKGLFRIGRRGRDQHLDRRHLGHAGPLRRDAYRRRQRPRVRARPGVRGRPSRSAAAGRTWSRPSCSRRGARRDLARGDVGGAARGARRHARACPGTDSARLRAVLGIVAVPAWPRRSCLRRARRGRWGRPANGPAVTPSMLPFADTATPTRGSSAPLKLRCPPLGSGQHALLDVLRPSAQLLGRDLELQRR